MNNKYFGKVIYTIIALLSYISTFAQSGSFGNTHIGSGGEMSIIDVQHNFLNGGSGVQPGVVTTVRTTPKGYLSFVGTASHTGASNTAHVDGYVRSYETGVFTFPIGDNGKLRTASVSAASNSTPSDAAYYNVNPTTDSYTSTSVAAGVVAVSTIEYWDINGSIPARITLTWDGSSGVTSLADTKIVGWNGSQWVNIPATTGVGSTTTTGSIITDNTITPNTYTVYTLAGIGVLSCTAGTVAPTLTASSKSNTCPATTVDLTTITATNLPNGTTLTWHTATPATSANKVATPNSVGAGTYYATFFDATNNCYSSSGNATTPVTATVGSCTSVDLTTVVGQPSPSPVAGQPSNLPVTVSNIGTGPTTGTITETVAIPSGTSFGTFPTAANNNGWACTPLTATTASCTNSNPIAAGGNSTLNVPFIPTASQVGTPLTVPPATVAGGGEPAANNTNNASPAVTTPAVAGTPDLTTVVGQPSPSPVAGQPSNLPVTVSNIGTGPTTGPITETVAIPSGTSFGTFPPASSNNGWACTPLTATTASCTNSNPIAAGGNSTLNVPFIPTASQVGTPLTVPPATVAGGGEPSNNNGNNASTPVTTPNVVSTNGLLTMKAFLQGALSGTTMTTLLNTKLLIPLTDPYSKGATTTDPILTANSITDWVLVELRSASASGTVVESIAALLKNDGTLLNSDGTTPLRFSNSSGNFYVAVRHRNHLGVMTGTPIAILATTTSIDFTNPTVATYGNATLTPAQKTVGSVTAMWAGNATSINSSSPDNVRQTTLLSDAATISNKIAPNGGGTTQVPGYFPTDLNLDGTTRQSTLSSDRLIISNNISTHPGNATGAKTFVITQLF